MRRIVKSNPLLLLFFFWIIASGSAQNLVKNPSIEIGAGWPAPQWYEPVDPFSGPDRVPDWTNGCPQPASIGVQAMSNAGLAAAGFDTYGNGIFLRAHTGERVLTAILRNDYPNYVNQHESAVRGEFIAPLQEGMYKFEAFHTGFPRVNDVSDGIVSVYLIDLDFACTKGDRRILEAHFDDNLEWQQMGTCFNISSNDAGIYEAIELRLELPQGPEASVILRYFVDDVSVELTGNSPDLSHLDGLLCADEAFVDVSSLNDYTLTIDPNTFDECIITGNGNADGIVHLNDLCPMACAPAQHTVRLQFSCGGSFGTVTSGSFSIRCNPPSVDLGADFQACEGVEFPELDAGAGFAGYEWTHNGQAVPCSGGASPWLQPACAPGTWCVTVVDGDGCAATDCMEVLPAENLIVNPDFSGVAIRGDLGFGCNQTAPCNMPSYCQVTNPQEHCASFPASPVDHSGTQYAQYFASYICTPTAGTVLWYQEDIPVEAGLQYEFTGFFHYVGQTIASRRPNIAVKINGQTVISQLGSAQSNVTDWLEWSALWTANVTDKIRIEVVQTNGVEAGRFAIDDFSLYKICCPVEAPTGLGCSSDINGNITLHWQASPFPVSFEIRFIPNADDCGCSRPQNPTTAPIPVSGNTYPAPGYDCYGWQVRSICGNGNESPWSAVRCQTAFSGCFGIPQKVAEPATMEVFPNPSNGPLTIQVSPEVLPAQAQIFDQHGRQVGAVELTAPTTEIWGQRNPFPAGIYHIQVTGDDFRVVKRWVVQ